MNTFDACKEVLQALTKHVVASEGDSNDAESEAGIDLREATLKLVRAVAGHDVEIADLIDSYEKRLVSQFSDPQGDYEEGDRYTNYYVHCGEIWCETWSCMCNDKCPKCNKEIEPFASLEEADLTVHCPTLYQCSSCSGIHHADDVLQDSRCPNCKALVIPVKSEDLIP